jgi:hypothetical protein
MYLEILEGIGPKLLVKLIYEDVVLIFVGDTFETHFSTKVYHKNDTWAGIRLEIEFLPNSTSL